MEAVRHRGLEIFAGRLTFDGESGRASIAYARRLLDDGAGVLSKWRTAGPGGRDDDADALRQALDDLERFLRAWVTPQLAVGPSARVKLDLSDDEIQAVRRKIADLPPPTP